MRLVSSSFAHIGRVEVHYNESWGTVCNTQWDIQDANVICKQLGYTGAESTQLATAIGNGTIWISGAQCNGEELSIGECNLQEVWGMTHCTHHEDVEVECTGEWNIIIIICKLITIVIRVR